METRQTTVSDRIQKTGEKSPPPGGGGLAANRYKTLLSSRNHLYNSTRYIPSYGMVRIVNEVPYAAVHNEGLKAGRGKGFQMPRRQFIGESRELNGKVEKLIEDELRKIFNS